MNEQEIKSKMMKLWKDTFHDSDAYISLIFEQYFNKEFVEYICEKDEVVSALIGIPYIFGNGEHQFCGIYLCGLATKEEFRHRGYMNDLIEKINDKARQKGYVISFLIPASDMLRIYYQSKGYVNGMYRVEERYTDIHDFHKDCLYMINREEDKIRNNRLKYIASITVELYKEQDEDKVQEIVKYISTKEQKNYSYITLQHSPTDIINIVKENTISGGEVYIAKNERREINGVAFVTFDDRKRITIPKIYYEDKCTYLMLLDKIKKLHPESSMSVLRFPEETDRHVLWSKVYGAANPDGGMLGGAYGVAERVYDVSMHSQPYGMVKILNYHEILKFQAAEFKDSKFSILIKEGISQEKNLLYNIGGGKLQEKEIKDENLKNLSSNITTLSQRDLAEILFRKKDGNSLIMEAFGIPRFTINMALLLD